MRLKSETGEWRQSTTLCESFGAVSKWSKNYVFEWPLTFAWIWNRLRRRSGKTRPKIRSKFKKAA